MGRRLLLARRGRLIVAVVVAGGGAMMNRRRQVSAAKLDSIRKAKKAKRLFNSSLEFTRARALEAPKPKTNPILLSCWSRRLSPGAELNFSVVGADRGAKYKQPSPWLSRRSFTSDWQQRQRQQRFGEDDFSPSQAEPSSSGETDTFDRD